MNAPPPLCCPDILYEIGKYLHPKDIINLHNTSKIHNYVFNKKFIERHCAALKIQKYFKRYKTQKNFPFVFLEKLLYDPTFRSKYLYIHEPNTQQLHWDLDDCETYPHICLRESITIDPFFCKVFGGPVEFSKWFNEYVDKSLQDRITNTIINLPNKQAREDLLEKKSFK